MYIFRQMQSNLIHFIDIMFRNNYLIKYITLGIYPLDNSIGSFATRAVHWLISSLLYCELWSRIRPVIKTRNS